MVSKQTKSDVKVQPSGSVLSKSVRSSPATPKPQICIKDDYVISTPVNVSKTATPSLAIDGTKSKQSSATVPSGTVDDSELSTVKGTDDKSKQSKGSTIPESLSKALQIMGKSTDDLANLVKMEYLRSIGDGAPVMSDSIYYVGQGTYTEIKYSAPLTVALNQVGAAATDPEFYRISNVIRMKTLKLRITVQVTNQNSATGVNWQPNVYITVWREKLPAVASGGNAEFVPYFTGNNPPTNTYYGLYSRLGAATEEGNQVAVRNPQSMVGAEVYKRHFINTSAEYMIPTSASGSVADQAVPSRKYHIEWDIPIHRLSHYSDVAATRPIDNYLFMQVELDRDMALAPDRYFWIYSSELRFESITEIGDKNGD